MNVAIIDYGMSNLHSVQAACNNVGLSSVITSDTAQILSAKIAILPGVGAFAEAMLRLSNLKLDDCIIRFVETGKPFVGICLGLQLLFEKSEEFGSHKGLGLIKGIGEVAKKLGVSESVKGKGYRSLANIGENGGQEVPHLHFHIFGGEKVGKMVSN